MGNKKEVIEKEQNTLPMEDFEAAEEDILQALGAS